MQRRVLTGIPLKTVLKKGADSSHLVNLLFLARTLIEDRVYLSRMILISSAKARNNMGESFYFICSSYSSLLYFRLFLQSK